MSKLPRLCAVALLLAAGPAHAESGDGDADSPSAGSLSEFVDFDLRTLLSLEVEGAARRPQARLEAPQAVYVLTRDDIRESGATNLAELLRQVPGVFVVQSSATTFTVGIRGVNASTQLINRGMLVLVDGRQTLERGFGIQPWWSLGVELSDIERVEVVRGPGSVVYGSNALTGVINIVTRSPLDAEGVDLDAWGSIAALSEQRSSSRARARAGGGQPWPTPGTPRQSERASV
jgi:outer membrane receptor protein involved in Fe transport